MNTAVVKQWLKENERSEAWLSRKAGIGLATVYRLLNKAYDPRISTLQSISYATGIPMTMLIEEPSESISA